MEHPTKEIFHKYMKNSIDKSSYDDIHFYQVQLGGAGTPRCTGWPTTRAGGTLAGRKSTRFNWEAQKSQGTAPDPATPIVRRCCANVNNRLKANQV